MKQLTIALGCSVVAILLAEVPLEAYLDPGSGSMLVQLLLGGVAGVAVMLKLGWRRLRTRIGAIKDDERTTSDE